MPSPQTTRRQTIAALIVAGIAAEVIFEFYGLVIAPVLWGFAMEPANLVMGLLKTLLGIEASYAGAYVLHLAMGAIGFPIGYWLLRKTILLGCPGMLLALAGA